MSKIFAINAGSSSLKFQLLAMPEEKILAKGIFERIGDKEAILSLDIQGSKEKVSLAINTHKEAVAYLLDILCQKGVVQNLTEISGVGHRVAHGGSYFKDSALIDNQVVEYIDKLSFLAPSHNPVNLDGIKAFREILPQVPNVAVFDTAFHQTLSAEHYLYPLPKTYYEKYGLRKYGFHGTSHKYIAQRLEDIYKDMDREVKDLKLISCHLGNGASLCAIRNQESVNTSMGFTPLAGLMMGSRSGDIDPAIVSFLMDQEGLTTSEITAVLNKKSGLLAISEISNDLRDIEAAYQRRSSQASLAINMFVNRIAHTIASYCVDLDGLDALVFTAGIGENSVLIREKVVERLACLGIGLNKSANEAGELFIQSEDSKVDVLILPTNEEVMIARDTLALISH